MPAKDCDTSPVTPGFRAAPFPVPAFLRKEAQAAQANDAAAFKAEGEQKPAPAAEIPAPVDNVISLEPQRTARVMPVGKLDFSAFADMVNSQPEKGAAPAIRCGLWSDGSVEIQRDGQTTAVLFVEEVACLADFWKRVSANAKEAM
jgi:hypothetical protein